MISNWEFRRKKQFKNNKNCTSNLKFWHCCPIKSRMEEVKPQHIVKNLFQNGKMSIRTWMEELELVVGKNDYKKVEKEVLNAFFDVFDQSGFRSKLSRASIKTVIFTVSSASTKKHSIDWSNIDNNLVGAFEWRNWFSLSFWHFPSSRIPMLKNNRGIFFQDIFTENWKL